MRRSGFTFIEVMLVSVLFAVLSVSIFKCLSDGIKLSFRAKQMMSGEDSLVLFDRMSSDLRNTFSFSGIDFSGDESSVTFPSIVWTPPDHVSMRADEGLADQIGRIGYAYDPVNETVIRRQANYSQALSGSFGPDEVLCSGVKSFRLRYFYGASTESAARVEPSGGIPSGVEVEISVVAPSGQKVFKRYVTVPVGA
ncbi:MAG: prepilin-type N-terminal cleavage/methylation domain-containing protein [Candidatus Omnitrophota bacterium]